MNSSEVRATGSVSDFMEQRFEGGSVSFVMRWNDLKPSDAIDSRITLKLLSACVT